MKNTGKSGYRKMLTVIMCLGCMLLFFGCFPKINFLSDGTEHFEEIVIEGEGSRKVLEISIEGTISHNRDEGLLTSRPGMMENVVAQLRKAEKDQDIKGLLLKVESPGGTVTASDVLYHEIMRFKKKQGIPIVVCMMGMAASGGYYVSLPADIIIAHPTTVTGSVGVIFMRPGITGLMKKIGLVVDMEKSGINKDMGSPFRETTDQEKQYFNVLIGKLGKRFVDLVEKHRKISPEKLKTIATGRIFSADEALALGLVDEIGYLDQALEKVKQLAGLPENAKVITYLKSERKNPSLYSTEAFENPARMFWERMASTMSFGLKEPGFFYIWAGAIGN